MSTAAEGPWCHPASEVPGHTQPACGSVVVDVTPEGACMAKLEPTPELVVSPGAEVRVALQPYVGTPTVSLTHGDVIDVMGARTAFTPVGARGARDLRVVATGDHGTVVYRARLILATTGAQPRASVSVDRSSRTLRIAARRRVTATVCRTDRLDDAPRVVRPGPGAPVVLPLTAPLRAWAGVVVLIRGENGVGKLIARRAR